MVKPRNLKAVGIEDDGEWTVVDQVDFHIGAKDAVRHVFDILANERQEVLVELVGNIGGACIGKRWAATVAAEKYTVNAKHGSIMFNDITGVTGAIVASYSYGAANVTAMFTQPLPERWVRFEGLNTADANKEVVIDLYRVAINPTKDLSVIGTELMKFELSSQVLADLTKAAAGALGQFGRMVLMPLKA